MANTTQSALPLEADAWTNDEAGDDDADSTLAVSITSSSDSLASSIMRHREENGRTYHAFKEGKYVLPNDESENERLGQSVTLAKRLILTQTSRFSLQHTLFLMILDGKLFTCPAGTDRPVRRVLDAGTGTGIWAVDYADDHPEADVIGVDLSRIQPSFVPTNISFFLDDLEDPWTFSQKLDFVYGRMLTRSLRNWPKFIQQSYDNPNSGGWTELTDILLELESDDNTVPANSPAKQWGKYMLEAAASFGAPLDSCKWYKQQLADAGFVDIVKTVYKWPTCAWPKDPTFKEIGLRTYENLGQGVSGLSLALFTRGLVWTPEEVEVFLVDVRKDMKNRAVHGWWPIYVVYGRKP